MNPRTQPSALWLVAGSIVSVQLGAAIAKTVFGIVDPTSMAWLRLASSAAVLWVAQGVGLARRRNRPAQATKPLNETPAHAREGLVQPRRDWVAGLGYAACLVGMNWSFYHALGRIPQGIAVTLEFLGPLAVAVAGARRLRQLAWPALALAGVALLGATPTRLDPVGVAFALVAAACWAGYIPLAARAGRTWRSLDALTLACTLGGVVLAAPAISQSGSTLLLPAVLLAGAGAGLLSSVVPYLLEMQALRSIAPRVFGVLMSLEPAVAAALAWLVLRESLSPTDLLAMACVVAASIGATRTAHQ